MCPKWLNHEDALYIIKGSIHLSTLARTEKNPARLNCYSLGSFLQVFSPLIPQSRRAYDKHLSVIPISPHRLYDKQFSSSSSFATLTERRTAHPSELGSVLHDSGTQSGTTAATRTLIPPGLLTCRVGV